VSDGVNRPEQFFSDQFWCMSKSPSAPQRAERKQHQQLIITRTLERQYPCNANRLTAKRHQQFFGIPSLCMLCDDDKKTRARDCVSSHFLITRSSLLPWQSEWCNDLWFINKLNWRPGHRESESGKGSPTAAQTHTSKNETLSNFHRHNKMGGYHRAA